MWNQNHIFLRDAAATPATDTPMTAHEVGRTTRDADDHDRMKVTRLRQLTRRAARGKARDQGRCES